MLPQVFRTPLRAVWEVANKTTETLWWPSRGDGKKTVLFFIPGNPGLAEYYTQFLQDIHEHSAPSLEICAVSHLGHSVGSHTVASSRDAVYTLQEQIEHKIDCFDQLRKDNPGGTQFILMGHSVGAYICAEVLKQRQQHDIVRLIALFPTLREIALTPNGVFISRLLSKVPLSVLSGTAHMLSYISSPIREYVTGMVTGQEGHCLKVTAHQLLHQSVVKNAFAMANNEMASIKELDHDFYTTHVDKMIVYFSKVDKWAPLDHYEYMKEKFPNAHIHLCEEDLPHAFILDSKHSAYMAHKVRGWIEEILQKS
ncbi:uncharacterized protein BYT42DRAFT_587990 [Radiomyces spectabilis]|uniref:uncharacterized protein n=1 Tax=Radiomyces spectabilis TaxID=64574 RepID=UPI00221F8351|nr:uncharacterized protein BYT42DRAFT_587990 [Radiomyces spectabilis]KAI8366822.1 hypothetical protein BYT42DRAFT_587990 [Radiomyces spectabilis]